MATESANQFKSAMNLAAADNWRVGLETIKNIDPVEFNLLKQIWFRVGANWAFDHLSAEKEAKDEPTS